MTDRNPQHLTSAVDPGSIGFVPFLVDLDAICDRPVFGPLWWEYATELKGPVYLSAPQKMLPDGHPRKPKTIGRRWRSRVVSTSNPDPSHLDQIKRSAGDRADDSEHE